MDNLFRSFIVFHLWFIYGVHGRALLEPTQPPHIADHDRPLRTTHIEEPPKFRHVAKRRETDMQIEAFPITIAPDATCGFISGSPYNPVTCDNRHHQCAWDSHQIKAILCGAVLEDPKNWGGYHLSCLGREEALNTDLCNDACQSGPTLRCTNKSAPYCLTYAYPKGVKDYRCAQTSVLQSVSFTVDTERAAQFITATVVATVPSEPSTATDTEPVTSTIPETSMAIPPPPLPSTKHNSNLGSIIGGAVGGFAALLLIALIIFWFVRRSKRDDAPGKAGQTKTYEMRGEPSHHEVSGEPSHYEMSGEPAYP